MDECTYVAGEVVNRRKMLITSSKSAIKVECALWYINPC